MTLKVNTTKQLCDEIASALEDHAIIPYNQKKITSDIVDFYLSRYMKKFKQCKC
jgi:hypothetical protein